MDQKKVRFKGTWKNQLLKMQEGRVSAALKVQVVIGIFKILQGFICRNTFISNFIPPVLVEVKRF